MREFIITPFFEKKIALRILKLDKLIISIGVMDFSSRVSTFQ